MLISQHIFLREAAGKDSEISFFCILNFVYLWNDKLPTEPISFKFKGIFFKPSHCSLFSQKMSLT